MPDPTPSTFHVISRADDARTPVCSMTCPLADRIGRLEALVERQEKMLRSLIIQQRRKYLEMADELGEAAGVKRGKGRPD